MFGLRTAIVIPCFNRSAFTRICLASLADAELGGAHVVVVDSGSTDETPALLARWASVADRRTVVSLGTNSGFAVACNAGASAVPSDQLVFLNNDTYVLQDWLENLLAPLQDPEVGVVGCKLLYPDGTVQHAGVAFGPHGPQHVFAGVPADHPAVSAPRGWQAVTAASMAIRTADFKALGGFDEAYENGFEDTDLCLRAAARGSRVVYAPTAVAYHFESMTEGRVGDHERRNHALFQARWADKYDRDLEAEEGRFDLSTRVKPKWLTRAEELEHVHQMAMERNRLQAEVAELRGELNQLEDEVRQLRETVGLRSVQYALAAQRTFRRVVPPADRGSGGA